MHTELLIVDDDPFMTEILEQGLGDRGYNVTARASAQAAMTAIASDQPDLVLLDVNLPDMSGYQICQNLRRDAATRELAIIMLSACTDNKDIVNGLRAGADDYVTKPFDFTVLREKIEAVLRRRRLGEAARPQSLSYKSLDIDMESRTVFQKSEPVELTYSEFEVLSLFVLHPGRAFRRDEILNTIRGEACTTMPRAVDFQVYSLRKKLPVLRKHLRSVRYVGYMLEPDESKPDAN